MIVVIRQRTDYKEEMKRKMDYNNNDKGGVNDHEDSGSECHNDVAFQIINLI